MFNNASDLLIVIFLCYTAVMITAFLCWRIDNEKEE